MLCKLKAPANRATCWPTFELDLNVDQYVCMVFYTIFFQGKSNQHSWIFIHSLVDYLSRMSECEAAACLIIALIIDNDGKKSSGSTRKWIPRREKEEMYANLVQELLVEDTRAYTEKEFLVWSQAIVVKILTFILITEILEDFVCIKMVFIY